MKNNKLRNNVILITFTCLIFVFLIIVTTSAFNKNNKKEEVTNSISKSTLTNALESLDIMETLSFTEDKSVFINPEKGFYRPYELDDIWGIDKLKALNISLIMIEVNLAEFKNGPISSTKLTEISNTFALARKYNLKVIFRAAYDYDGVIAPEPSDINVLLNHIAQLKTVFTQNEDVLYVVQAGFIGSWGEWHSTIYGPDPKKYNDPPLDVRKKIVDALMDSVPESRMIQIRVPKYIRDMYPSQTLTDSTAFNGSKLARTGFHNDGLFYNESDCGTYNASGYDRAKELAWANTQMKYTPFGGESNGLSSYSDPINATSDLEKLHAQYLNIDYYGSVISKWKNTTYNGENTFSYISRKLGYRFLLTDAKISSKVYVAGAMHVVLNVKNDGFGGLINYRNLEVVLSDGTTTYKAKVNEDLRKWYKENGVMTKDLYFTIPSNIKPGNWNVYLNFPDASDTLRNNPNYSIRLSNTGVWNGTTGYNLLKSGLIVEDVGLRNTNTSFSQTNRSHAEELMGINPGISVTSVSITPKNLSLQSGMTSQLTSTVLPADATEKSVTYSSSNPSVATVNSNGLITAISSGTAVITATTLSEAKTATSTVTVFTPAPVVIPVTSVTLSPQEKTISKGQTFTLTTTVLPTDASNKNVSYTSSNPSVVSVSNTGVITGISAGAATITVTSISDGKIGTSIITVLQPVESVSLPLQNLSIEIGNTYMLAGTVNPSSASNKNINYTSSNIAIATIDAYGKLTAISKGTTIITAKSVDGEKTATCTVNVVEKPTDIIPPNTTPSWNNINPISERTTGTARTLKAYNSDKNLYLLVTGSELRKKSQFYINIDNNTNTGFKTLWSSSGVEYLIENGNLYKYSGTDNNWKWTYVADVSITKSSSMIGVTIPLSKLGININSIINIGFMSNDIRDNALPIKSLPLAPYTLGNNTNEISF